MGVTGCRKRGLYRGEVNSLGLLATFNSYEVRRDMQTGAQLFAA